MYVDIRLSVVHSRIYSLQDYVDACERLSQLNLTEVQQREIIRVLLHCCGNVSVLHLGIHSMFILWQERSYNPYYTLVGQQLCRTSHSYKITLQFCLWDVLRDMGEASVGGSEIIKNLKDDEFAIDGGRISPRRLRNVAKAYAWWIAKDSVMLSVLKVIVSVNSLMVIKLSKAHRFHVTQAANKDVPEGTDGPDLY
jgi:nucleolar MIF4G domain-containing protein 1